MSQQNLADLKAAAIDGRFNNPYYRQTQLAKLHKRLVADANKIQQTIVSDTGVTPKEARFEFSLALHALRQRYEELDADALLEEEYYVQHGQNAPNLTSGYGVVIIQPAAHNFFYSTIVPVAAAIAGGNGVAVILEKTLRGLPSLIQSVLESLDPDSVAIIQGALKDQTLLSNAVVVGQNGQSSAASLPSTRQVISDPNIPSAAFVDRTANIDEAAKAIIRTRVAFRGKSPYAPDLVLVNEFVKGKLEQALVREAIAFSNSDVQEKVSKQGQSLRDSGLKGNVNQLLSQYGDEARIVTQAGDHAILDISQRSRQLVSIKSHEPLLVIHAISSMDDGIDLLNSLGKPLTAAYHFGASKPAKYLSQFVSAQLTFINHIPPELLVGPAFPLDRPVNPSVRYPTSLFEKPTPAYVSPIGLSKVILDSEVTSNPTAQESALVEIYRESTKELKEPDRVSKTTMSKGFFLEAYLLHYFGQKALLVGGAAAAAGFVALRMRR